MLYGFLMSRDFSARNRRVSIVFARRTCSCGLEQSDVFPNGWLGVLAFTWLLIVGVGLLLRRALGDDITALGVVASFLGAMAIGLFGTLFFSPRIALLFYLALLLCIAGTGHKREPRPPPGNSCG